MKKITNLFILSLGMILFACSPSTKILGSWASPEKQAGGYNDIMILGISESVIGRQTFEDQVQNVLTQDGIKASNSSSIIPPGTRPSESEKEKFAQQLRAKGHDAILTVALLDQTNETRYVPGTTAYAPMGYGGYYRSYWGYYNYYSPLMYDPGYYTTDKNYYLEANLYDVNTEQLVWSSQSETTNPANLEAFARAFAMVISDQMIKDGIIIKKK
ncbi:hypothetical protein DFQ04_1519 [Algoriphagus boseongensis]|uniref:DUF4136 domain-containing protein n=1 Tax=Algoriphagus boseongensis TaxID=1442587 RepID=A0A4R6TE35_9BACT|nr:hypothetical protein [Algoriphagus boseongensis]TDQ19694.1 hypothetical protein DFQ04_1519 [Algoriphagus boseongensis]